MARKTLIALISIYQRTLSPDHGLMRAFFTRGVCIYQPTCSQYSKEAIEKYGIIKGLSMGLSRIVRCHPFAKGGLDPVPHVAHDVRSFSTKTSLVARFQQR